MPYDFYKPPQSDLLLLDAEPDFYIVSARKFLILAVSTLGIYYLYWFYQHWKHQKIKRSEKIWPLPRAIFTVFFTHSLFSRIQHNLKIQQQPFVWAPSFLATVYVFFSVTGSLADRLSGRMEMPMIMMLYGFLTLIPTTYATYKAQQAANLACEDAHGSHNDRITPVNMVWISLGMILWALSLLGLYIQLFGLPSLLLPNHA